MKNRTWLDSSPPHGQHPRLSSPAVLIMLAFTITLWSFFITLAHASPLFPRDVWAPKITSPNSGSVWQVGSTQTVTWDTSDEPAQVTNPIGKVILGQQFANGSLHLQINTPLAQGFPLTDGQVSITVPDVTASDDYIIVLMGDSGNTSPVFDIVPISATPANSSTSTSSTLITTPIPITGSTITGGLTDTPAPPITTSNSLPTTLTTTTTTTSTTGTTTSTVTSSSSSPTSTSSSSSPTSTSPSSSTHSTSTGTSSGSPTSSSPASSAGFSLHDTSIMKVIFVGMVSLVMARTL